MANILFKNVYKSFENKDILKDLSFEVNSGECFTIVGPSGCGKTVVLRLIAGFEVPDKGSISISDNIVASTNPKIFIQPENRKAGVVFQDYAVWPHKTVMGNVIYPLEIQKIEKNEAKRRAQKSIDMVNLTGLEDRLPYQLSGGQQQRVALSRALVADNNVLLLDEPLTNLDANLREEMRFEIKDIQRKTNNTIIYVTHDQAEAMALSDRILVMNFGVLQQLDTPLNVYNNPINRFVFSFIGLSNFIPVIFKNGKIFIKNHEIAGNIEVNIPKNYDRIDTLACRPGEIDFVSSGGIKGIIHRSTYLGDMVDYSIKVAGSEESGEDIFIRVQKLSRKYILKDGENCQLLIKRTLWYEKDD